MTGLYRYNQAFIITHYEGMDRFCHHHWCITAATRTFAPTLFVQIVSIHNKLSELGGFYIHCKAFDEIVAYPVLS